jgi:hypothetical protein
MSLQKREELRMRFDWCSRQWTKRSPTTSLIQLWKQCTRQQLNKVGRQGKQKILRGKYKKHDGSEIVELLLLNYLAIIELVYSCILYAGMTLTEKLLISGRLPFNFWNSWLKAALASSGVAQVPFGHLCPGILLVRVSSPVLTNVTRRSSLPAPSPVFGFATNI